MDKNQVELIELKTQLAFYKKLDNKIDLVLNAELELEDWQEEVYRKIIGLENKVSDLEILIS